MEADSGPVTSGKPLVLTLPKELVAITSLQAIDGLVFALGLVALGDHRRDARISTSAQEQVRREQNQLTSNKPC